MEKDVKIICVIMFAASIALIALTKIHASTIIHQDVQVLQQLESTDFIAKKKQLISIEHT